MAVLYFVVGAVLAMRYNIFDGDGLSRVANAGYVVLSRDPHLSAIGFVWNPLPSLIEIPLVPLSRWWPELRTFGLAGAVQSSLFMAGSAMMVRQIAIDRSVPNAYRLIVVGCFALNPMIVLVAAFGLSEAATMFCVLWCARHLLRWVGSMRTTDLAGAGLALGVGYLARYDVLATAAGVAVLVAAVAYRRSARETRTQSMLVCSIIAVFPTVMAVTIWAVTSWVISGELFATVTSVYGNASQVEVARMRGGEAAFTTGNWRLIAALLWAMQPFAGIAVAVAVVAAALTRTADTLVPVATFGAMLAFVVWGQFTGNTFNLFRYYLPAIPLVLVIALALWTTTSGPPRWRRLESRLKRLGVVLVCASAVIGVPVTSRSMFNANLGVRQQLAAVTSLFGGGQDAYAQPTRRIGYDDRLVARHLDRKNLPPGSVLMDTSTSWLVWLASEDPKQFVITSDFDFTTALNRPWDMGVKYFVISNPRSSAASAIQLRYPTMWADGAGIGELAFQVDGTNNEHRWRVYRVVEPTPTALAPRLRVPPATPIGQVPR
ncbi:hypothetical protein K3G64_03165 [Mycobacterium sp. IDR2000157661]|nr:hypothetical protein K3G64_03165 [Mycobacterium sp. IDR2000157661]